MKISGNSSFNPMLFAQSQKGRMPSADASAMQRAIEQAGEGQGPNGIMMAGNSQPPVDANTILENWGTSNAIADLNVDGIVDGGRGVHRSECLGRLRLLGWGRLLRRGRGRGRRRLLVAQRR